MPSNRRQILALAVVAAAGAMVTGAAGAVGGCDFVASPVGDDGAAGSVSAPFRTVQRLVDALGPGQTGCLRAGSYAEDVRVGSGGSAGAPVTLASYPGERATVVGRFWIAKGADYVTVEGLNLDGVNSGRLPSPTVNGDYATFSHDDVTNDHTAICFDLGDHEYGVATGTVITDDRVHGCGQLPAANHQHGIYVAAARDTTIAWNLIYDNADRGIQLYPDAQNTTVDHNVIDDNGEGIIFSGDEGYASSGAEVYDNLITGAVIRHDVESWYPAGNPVGTANVVRQNCVWGGKEGTIDTSGGGYTATGNTVANPQYVDAAAHDYHLKSTSPCLSITGDIAAAVDGSTPTHPTPGAEARSARPKAHAAVLRWGRGHRVRHHGRRAKRHGRHHRHANRGHHRHANRGHHRHANRGHHRHANQGHHRPANRSHGRHANRGHGRHANRGHRRDANRRHRRQATRKASRRQ
jgi:parallel beta-helix repeat protein